MLHERDRRAGGALIVCVCLLAVLAVLAAIFSRLMVLERGSARNYQSSVQARLAAEAGVERAVASIVADLRSGKLEDAKAAWRYYGEDVDRDDVADQGEDQNLNGVLERSNCPLLEAPAPSYAVSGKPYSGELSRPGLPRGWTVRYKLKVIDCNAMINLNNDYPNFYRLLDTFGIMLKDYLALDRDVIHSVEFGKRPNGQPILGGEAIVKYRDTLPGKVFRSREDLLPILPRGWTDLGLMESFLTVHGWRDDNEFLDKKRQIEGYNVPWWEYWWGPAHLQAVPRYPIHVNVADKVVLDSVNGTATGQYPAETPQRDFFWGPGVQPVSGGARCRTKESDYRIFAHGWWWSPYGGGAKWWSQMLVDHRRGKEVDANGDDLMQAAEDEIRNGWPDPGPFRMAQDYANMPRRVDHCGYEFMASAFTPHSPVMRYNPDFMPASFHHGGGGGLSFQWGSRFLSDKTTVGVVVPEWCFRPYGWFEITSLGLVQDDAGNIVASRTIRTVSHVFHALEQQTQKDFLSKPAKDASWKSGEAYPSEPWTNADANVRLFRTTTFPENAWDSAPAQGGKFDAKKAEPCMGGVMPTSIDWTLSNEIFFASFKADARAEKGPGGQDPTQGANQGGKHLEGVPMGNSTFATGSDLFTDGIHHHRYRGRSTTYPNAGFKSMRPDKGMHEFWWKCDSQYYPGEILTAFFPADPSVEATASTEGIQHRVFLAYVPYRTNAFQGLLSLPPTNVTPEHYYRWWNWGPLVDPGVLAMPVLVAERVFYAAQLDTQTGNIHGRDTGYLDLTTTASYANGLYAFTAANWVDYEYVPLLNWGRDQMWHQIRVNWKDGTDLELYVDGVRAPYRRTWPRSVWAQGGIVLPFWGSAQMKAEIHVGGVNLQEVKNGVGFKAWDPAFKWGPGGKYWAYPTPMWFMGTNGSDGTNHRHCGTIDNLRIFADPTNSPYSGRYMVTQLPDSTWNYGAYRNDVRLPIDATRLVRVAWDQWQPTYDPRIRSDQYLTGRHIKPADRPRVSLEVTTKAGSLKMDERTMCAAPYSLTADEAARIARGEGYSVDYPVEPGEVFFYAAHFQYRKLGGGSTFPHSLHVAPILESVTFFYTTRSPAFLAWEEF